MKIILTQKKKKLIVTLASILCAVAILFGACGLYLNDYYRADAEAINAFSYTGQITQTELDDGTLVYEPSSPSAGLIFYPGGKVEHTSYEPLMLALAQRGVLCLLVEMPFRLAVLDKNAADGLKEQFPAVVPFPKLHALLHRVGRLVLVVILLMSHGDALVQLVLPGLAIFVIA